MLRLCNFRPLSPPVRAHTLLAYTFPLRLSMIVRNTIVQIIFLKEEITDIFSELLSIKQRYKIKKLLYKAIGKCQIKTPKKALGSSLHFLTVQVTWEWIILPV